MNREIEDLVGQTLELNGKIQIHKEQIQNLEIRIEEINKERNKLENEKKIIEEQIENSETEISKYEKFIESTGKKINELSERKKTKNRQMNVFIQKYIEIIKNSRVKKQLLNELKTLYIKHPDIDMDQILLSTKKYKKMGLPQLQKQLELNPSDIDRFCIHFYIELELNDLNDSQRVELSRGGNKSKNSNKLRKSRLTKRRHRQH